MSYPVQCSNTRSVLSLHSFGSFVDSRPSIQTMTSTSSHRTSYSIIVIVVWFTLLFTFMTVIIRRFIVSRSKMFSCFATRLAFVWKSGRRSLLTIILLMLCLLSVRHHFATRNMIFNFSSNFYIYCHHRLNSHNLRTRTQLFNY